MVAMTRSSAAIFLSIKKVAALRHRPAMRRKIRFGELSAIRIRPGIVVREYDRAAT